MPLANQIGLLKARAKRRPLSRKHRSEMAEPFREKVCRLQHPDKRTARSFQSRKRSAYHRLLSLRLTPLMAPLALRLSRALEPTALLAKRLRHFTSMLAAQQPAIDVAITTTTSEASRNLNSDDNRTSIATEEHEWSNEWCIRRQNQLVNTPWD